MKLSHALLAVSTLATSSLFAASSASIYIPAAGSGPGANGSQWRSEVTFHNVAATPARFEVFFYTSEGVHANTVITMSARETTTASDLIKNQLEAPSSFGALEIRGDSTVLSKLAVTSRAVNNSISGEFGQDVPSYIATDAFVAGDTAVIPAPYHVAENRFNFGLFPLATTSIEWSLIRKDGMVAATKNVTYDALKQLQYSAGVPSFFGATPLDSDVVHARVTSGRVLFFGSSINNGTGDPSFIPAVRIRENFAPTFVGIDIDENGSVDVSDANGDGTLDQPLEIFTGSFPNFFRIIASDSEGKALTYSLVNPTPDAKFIDQNGTIEWLPGQSLRGSSGSITIRISDGIDHTDVVVPVVYR